ncbi:MAG: hypothetical protein E6K95_10085 [Thaumarchaeota archaeon]|nr:MAG: hypothetical protein E6K95_10085 [Nitrososphaerota archaeon]
MIIVFQRVPVIQYHIQILQPLSALMAIVTVRVDEETRRQMKRKRGTNWNATLGEAIAAKLKEEEGMNLARGVVLNEALRRKAKKGWNSVEVIRYWRERRYGKPVR